MITLVSSPKQQRMQHSVCTAFQNWSQLTPFKIQSTWASLTKPELHKRRNFEDQSTYSRETQFSPRKWQIIRQTHWGAMVRKPPEMYWYLNRISLYVYPGYHKKTVWKICFGKKIKGSKRTGENKIKPFFFQEKEHSCFVLQCLITFKKCYNHATVEQ